MRSRTAQCHPSESLTADHGLGKTPQVWSILLMSVGRRVRFLDFPTSRNSRHAFRASSTQRGSTGRARTLFAARSTTPIHVRSFATVAGPAPPARRARTWSTNMGVVSSRALLSPIGCRSKNSRCVCLLRCHFEIVSNVSIYQRMSSDSDGAPCVIRINAIGSSSATSRARAHFSAADRNSKVFDSRWTTTPFFLIRILAVYLTPEPRIRAKMCANANPPGATKDSGSTLVAPASDKCT